jgi:hypothetical protein
MLELLVDAERGADRRIVIEVEADGFLYNMVATSSARSSPSAGQELAWPAAVLELHDRTSRHDRAPQGCSWWGGYLSDFRFQIADLDRTDDDVAIERLAPNPKSEI